MTNRDPSSYGLGEIVELDTRGVMDLFADILSPLADEAHKFTASDALGIVNVGNALLNSEDFKQVYAQILSSAAGYMGETKIYAQRAPTFRVQLPGAKSVSFHTDDISSGHGSQITNYWLALSEVNASNGLHLVPPSDSEMILEDFRQRKLSLVELDRAARRVSKPVPLAAGQAICFSNRVLHGTVINNSNLARASLDFRCLPAGADLGTRTLGADFVEFPRVVENSEPAVVTSVIFQSGLMAHVGHQAQREVIRDFASRQGFQIARETSEWHHLEHYPVLEELLSQPDPGTILVFSKTSFNWGSEAGKRLTAAISSSAAAVAFCLEDEWA